MSILRRLRALLGRSGPDLRHRALVLRQLAALEKARTVLPNDPVIEREYRRVEQAVRDARL